MAQSPERKLAEFLAPLPQWLQKALWYDYSTMTDLESYSWLDSANPFTAEQLEELKTNPGWQPERYPQTAKELRPRFELILKCCDRAKWVEYCTNAKIQRAQDADSHVRMPRGNPGRKRNNDLAEHIWQLDTDGKSNLEIKQALNADGINLSLEGVESYLKTRRKNHSA